MSQVVNISSFDAINQNIVEVDNDKFDNKWLQQLGHYSHEYTEGIGLTEWHYQPLTELRSTDTDTI